MSEQRLDGWEGRVRSAAAGFPYPATPDIAASVRTRLAERPRRSAARRLGPAGLAGLALLALLALLLVPPVRAAVVEFLRIGAVRVVPAAGAPPATPPSATSAVPPTRPSPLSTGWPATPTMAPTPTPLISVLDLAGETTLSRARATARIPIRVPTDPADLGEPDRVHLQDMNGPVVVLVWIEPGNPDRARLSLHTLGPGTYARKFVGEVVREAEVGGRRALWTRGEHLLQFERGGRVIDGTRRLVQGNTLIWDRGRVTYRLETGLPLREAVKIAESLR